MAVTDALQVGVGRCRKTPLKGVPSPQATPLMGTHQESLHPANVGSVPCTLGLGLCVCREEGGIERHVEEVKFANFMKRKKAFPG